MKFGCRLGYHVEAGLYQGKTGKIGFDGIWRRENGYSIVVEVKTTNAYRIDINKIADYRNAFTRNSFGMLA